MQHIISKQELNGAEFSFIQRYIHYKNLPLLPKSRRKTMWSFLFTTHHTNGNNLRKNYAPAKKTGRKINRMIYRCISLSLTFINSTGNGMQNWKRWAFVAFWIRLILEESFSLCYIIINFTFIYPAGQIINDTMSKLRGGKEEMIWTMGCHDNHYDVTCNRLTRTYNGLGWIRRLVSSFIGTIF